MLFCNCLLWSITAQAKHQKKSTAFDDIKMLSTFLYTTSGNIADGNRVVFDAIYSNEVDRWDAKKMTNPGENFGLKRDGYTLAVEARQPISNYDTLYYEMTNLAPQSYQIIIEVQFLSATLQQAEWVDRYTNTRRSISLSGSNSFTININAHPESSAHNRFYLLFKPATAVLPVKFTAMQLQWFSKTAAEVSWELASENYVASYQIERSVDSIHFSLAGQVIASGRNAYHFIDEHLQPETYFYRIVAINVDGAKTYSSIKMITKGNKILANISMVNPAQHRLLQFTIENIPSQKVFVQLIGIQGKIWQKNELSFSGNQQKISIPLQANIQPGRYVVNVFPINGHQVSTIIIVP